MGATIKWALPVIVLAACESSTNTDGPQVASITFNPSTAVISQGESRTLALQIVDAEGRVLNDVDATWVSNNTNVLTVNQQGGVHGVALGGPVTVTVTAGGKTGTASVSVVPARIRFSPPDSTLVLGQTLQLSGTIEDLDGAVINTTAPITWSSASPEVATVGATTGLVTSVGAGYAAISATAAGRTTQRRIHVGTPTQHDGRWSGASSAAATGGVALLLSFEVTFGEVKIFTVTLDAPTFCGPVRGSASAGNVPIVAGGFALTLSAPTPGTFTGTFTSGTQLSGTHTAIGWGTQLTCALPSGGMTSVGAFAQAGAFTAAKQ